MQIIESTALGVRSAIFRLRAPDAGPDFVLFPMVHIGAPAYYEEIERRLSNCDLILYEGVRSRTITLLTRAYRLMGSNRRLGLVQQSSMKLDRLKDRMVHSDVSAESFESRWRLVPAWMRILIYLIAPTLGLYLRWFATRQFIAKHLGMDDRKSADEILADDDIEKLQEVTVNWRDRHLVTVIEQHRGRYKTSEACIGVLYGASHMRAVLRHLIGRHRYYVTSSAWVTVFDLDG